jgi:hypothetical protein
LKNTFSAKKVYLFICLCFSSIIVLSQGEIDNQKTIFYRDEMSFAALINSNGFGLNFRYGKRINYLNKTIFDFDFVTIRDLKEYKFLSTYNTRFYVFGKLNVFCNLRAGVGQQKEVYTKSDKGGLSIRYFYSGGVAIGLYKPIYYDFFNPTDSSVYIDQITSTNAPYILGRESFFKGMNETSVIPGLYAKAGITFEFSEKDQTISALEVGAILDAFPQRIPIMDFQENNWTFFSLFISYRFGKAFDRKDNENKWKLWKFKDDNPEPDYP